MAPCYQLHLIDCNASSHTLSLLSVHYAASTVMQLAMYRILRVSSLISPALSILQQLKGTWGDLENTVLTCSNNHESFNWTQLVPLNLYITGFSNICIGLRGQLAQKFKICSDLKRVLYCFSDPPVVPLIYFSHQHCPNDLMIDISFCVVNWYL